MYTSNCTTLYIFWIAVFSCAVIPLSCMDLKEQRIWQITMSVFRIVTMLLMIGTAVAAMMDSSASFYQATPSGVLAPVVFQPASIPLFDLAGLHRILPICVYAQVSLIVPPAVNPLLFFYCSQYPTSPQSNSFLYCSHYPPSQSMHVYICLFLWCVVVVVGSGVPRHHCSDCELRQGQGQVRIVHRLPVCYFRAGSSLPLPVPGP